jgi:peptidoglycan/xylan/chitin deacetylase (PgdA/CDA1 family)
MYSSVKEPPTERISKVSKGSIYHFIRTALEHLYHIRNLPFVSLWNFPGDSRNVFLFRVDTDFGSQDQVNRLYKTIREDGIKGTWFIETQSSENWINKYSSFEEQELALHCYRHRIINNYKKDYENFKKGIEILNRVAIFPNGIAAPFGEWNNTFNRVVEDLGFEYSSEFSYSYDNFPHPVVNNNRQSKVLQIPIHPVSFGRLSRAGYDDNEMYEYFINVINQKMALCEPVIIYTHPLEERYDVHKRIFNFVNEMNLYKITFIEYSRWWKKRSEVKYKALFENNKLKIESGINDESFRLRVSLPSYEKYLIPLSGNDDRKTKLDFGQFKYDSDFQPDIFRKYTKRMLKDDILFEVRKRKL